MPSTSTSSLIGWALSFLIYILILIGAVFALQSHITKNVKYTASKKNLLNVTLVERKVKKQNRVKKKKVVKEKTTVAKKTPKKNTKILRATKDKEKPNFKNLFKKINLDKIPEVSKKREQKVRKKIVKKRLKKL